jgi:hypothetical protein
LSSWVRTTVLCTGVNVSFYVLYVTVCVGLPPAQGVPHYPLPREHVMISPCIMRASLIGLRRNMAPWDGKKETATSAGEHLIGRNCEHDLDPTASVAGEIAQGFCHQGRCITDVCGRNLGSVYLGRSLHHTSLWRRRLAAETMRRDAAAPADETKWSHCVRSLPLISASRVRHS